VSDTSRRRRAPGLLDTTFEPAPAKFDAELWADDALDLLDYVKSESAAKRPSPNEQRRRVRRYLNVLHRMLGGHPAFRGHDVRGDLTVLSLALDGLDSGVEHQILRRRTGGNRPPETRISRQFRLIVLQLCDQLIRAGMHREAAYKFLADELTAVGVAALKPKLEDANRDFKAATIKRWYQATRARPNQGKGPERPDDAEWLLARPQAPKGTSVEDLQRWARSSLRLPLVQAIFPKCAKADF
jgi:hypothetical protein